MQEGQPALHVADVVDADGDEAFRVHDDTPIEQLLGSEGLRSLGALMVIDRDDRLRGVVTLEQVRRALAAATPGAWPERSARSGSVAGDRVRCGYHGRSGTPHGSPKQSRHTDPATQQITARAHIPRCLAAKGAAEAPSDSRT